MGNMPDAIQHVPSFQGSHVHIGTAAREQKTPGRGRLGSADNMPLCALPGSSNHPCVIPPRTQCMLQHTAFPAAS